ncbi:MAG: GNAT family N-acetyltransferase, partial [Kangiellaceae bacterium]|nr:GNAT family N-acetyltransferase [Kangiellaceae bacterium]
MLMQAANKIKTINSVIARPFLATAEKFRPQARDTQEQASDARFKAYFASNRKEILEAQRLRFRVFSEEYGVSFKNPFGVDRDRFDKHCLHLLVRDNQSGELVGYTRLLPSERTSKSGGFYSAEEFYMGMVTGLQGRIVEIGRTCIHPDYRSGAVITVLWSRLAQYMLEMDVAYLIGCASVGLDENYDVQRINQKIRLKHLSDLSERVSPRVPYPLADFETDASAEIESGHVAMPPLLKAYLRM